MVSPYFIFRVYGATYRGVLHLKIDIFLRIKISQAKINYTNMIKLFIFVFYIL
jgi:hypothetical protein